MEKPCIRGIRGDSYGKIWCCGICPKPKVLRKGSSIIQHLDLDFDLAKEFSHKPTIISIPNGKIQLHGAIQGFLYRVGEDMGSGDLYPNHSSPSFHGFQKEMDDNKGSTPLLIGRGRL